MLTNERFQRLSSTEWTRGAALFLFCFTLVAVTGVFFFSSAGVDDAHITYWPAYTLRQFGQIVNYNGDLVEQGSSLLHVLTIAGLGFLGLDIELAGALSSLLLGAVALLASARLGEKLFKGNSLAIALLIGTFPYFVYWANATEDSPPARDAADPTDLRLCAPTRGAPAPPGRSPR